MVQNYTMTIPISYTVTKVRPILRQVLISDKFKLK